MWIVFIVTSEILICLGYVPGRDGKWSNTKSRPLAESLHFSTRCVSFTSKGLPVRYVCLPRHIDFSSILSLLLELLLSLRPPTSTSCTSRTPSLLFNTLLSLRQQNRDLLLWGDGLKKKNDIVIMKRSRCMGFFGLNDIMFEIFSTEKVVSEDMKNQILPSDLSRTL